MRHNKKFNHLSRKKGHREALLNNNLSFGMDISKYKLDKD